MTARQVAALMDSREVKRGKLWKARCPAHNGKNRTLDISDGKRGVLLTCWSHRCTVKEICAGLGIKVSDLFDGKPTKEIRQRVSLRERKEALERRWILCEMLSFLEPASRDYWLRAAQRHQRELFWVRWELESDRVEQETLKIVKRLRDDSRTTSAART